MKATVNAVLFKSKVLRNGESPVMIRVTRNRQSRYITLGITCPADLWDQAKGIPKTKHPLYKELTTTILKTKLAIQKELLTLTNEDQDFSLDRLTTLSHKAPVPVKVLGYFDQVIKQLTESGRIGYANIFRSTANSLRNFKDGKDFLFTDVNPSFLMKYEAWFLSRNVMFSSIFVFMRTFKTLVNYARKEGYVKPDFLPFKDFSFSKYRRVKTRKRSLTKAQVQAIAGFATKPGTSLFHAKNYFLFSYYCRGINFIDMALLKRSNVKAGRIQYSRRKTKELFTINLLKPAQEILDLYRPSITPSEDGYIFPILRIDFHISPVQIDNRIDKVNRQVNSSLKEIGKQLGIEEKLTTYVARHSFATVLKREGISIAIISELMGHDSEQTTRIYLQGFGDDLLDEATQSVIW
ncbi:site-specific integrase [Fibrella forsythiae]|uniref:Site-specific integrase n=1 Tax=Fibrella forsythiae TaxID=2817061 RepID=A0ABS3JPV7_9BACT|nr:site-specific integrase [Fibrella forsythiae]MBO0952023.1 site-specific integrase [Fibrella forsythiae]